MNRSLKFCFIFMLVIFFNQAKAQISIEVVKNKRFPISGEFGFNVTDFVRQFVVFNSSNLNLPVSPYAMNGKIFYGNGPNKFGLRLGVGYKFDENTSTGNNNTTDFITKEESFVYRIGIEYQQKISNKFKLFYGIDYQRNKSNAKTENRSFNGGNIAIATNEFYNKTRGFAGVIGVQYNINKYLNVHTETRIGYKTGEGGNNQTNTANPEFNRGEANGLRSAIFDLPAFINLNIMF